MCFTCSETRNLYLASYWSELYPLHLADHTGTGQVYTFLHHLVAKFLTSFLDAGTTQKVGKMFDIHNRVGCA